MSGYCWVEEVASVGLFASNAPVEILLNSKNIPSISLYLAGRNYDMSAIRTECIGDWHHLH